MTATMTVGRERELEEVDAALDALGGETLGCLAVQGDPGIGKTRLLAELRERADARGHVCLAGSSAEFERDLPFGVWEDALDAHAAAVADDSWSDELVAELAGMLPSLRAARGGDVTSIPDERYRVHRAIRALLEVLAADKPLVIVLDDLHWSDDASIELIGSVLHRRVDAPVLLALGVRAAQVPRGLKSALAMPSTTVLELEPLCEADAVALAGDGLPGARRREIFAESGGNPFYIEQLARAGPGAGDRLGQAGRARGAVPAAVAAALDQELEALAPPVRRFLEGAAVAGDPFDPELAGEIAELRMERSLDALDELLAARLLRTTDVPRRFAFRHPLVRQAVYGSAPAGWRLAAHGRAAAALARRGGAASTRAHHVEQSAAGGDVEAIELFLAAGAETSARAPATAVRWYEAALRLMSDADRAGRIGTLVELAGCLRHVGDLPGSRARLLEAIDLLPGDETALRVALTSACAVTETFMGRHEHASRRLSTALSELPDRRSPEGVAVLLSQAGECFFTAQIERMWDLACDALAIARSLDDPMFVGAALAMVAHAGAMHGELAAAEAARIDASAYLAALPDDEAALRVEDINRLGWAEFYMGLYEPSMVHLARGLTLSRASGRGEFIPLMTQAMGLDAMMLGDLAQAAELHDRSLEGARLAANPYMTCAALITSAQIARLQGDLDAAYAAAREGVRLAGGSDDGIIPALCATVLATLMVGLGEPDAAVDEVIARAGGWELPLLPTLWQARYQDAKAGADITARRLADARVAATRAEAAAERCPIAVTEAYALRARAAVLLADGHPRAAADAAFASAERADGAGTRIEAATSRLLAGRALAESGERPQAVEALRGAEHVLATTGAVRLRDEARRELRRLGARSEPRGPAPGESGFASLTKREREIADLVWDRQTNRQIAAALFLSDKTIESHLRNIFFKLGVSSRVDVARSVERARSAQP